MKLRRAGIVLTALCVLLISPVARAQVNVRGQILLPNGDLPREPIRFEITCTNGYHDLIFTDSGGRFILERLDPNLEYVITVDSDESTWGLTQYHFHPGETDTPRFYLNPMPVKKGIRPGTISAKSGYSANPEAVDLHDRGLKAYQTGDAAAAEGLLRSATQKDPKFAAAYNDLGVVLSREKKYADAEEALRKGLEQDAKSPDLQANLGTVLNHENRFADAVTPLQEALRLRPAHAETHLQLGLAFVETDKLFSAREQLLEAEKDFADKAATNATLQMYLGELYARTGDFKLSIAAFERYLTLEPNSANTPAVKNLVERMKTQMEKNNPQ